MVGNWFFLLLGSAGKSPFDFQVYISCLVLLGVIFFLSPYRHPPLWRERVERPPASDPDRGRTTYGKQRVAGKLEILFKKMAKPLFENLFLCRPQLFQ